jgi:hypothetical protein
MRFATAINRMVQSFFSAWRLLVIEQKANLHTAVNHREGRVVERVFRQWNEWASEMHKVWCICLEGSGCPARVTLQ